MSSTYLNIKPTREWAMDNTLGRTVAMSTDRTYPAELAAEPGCVIVACKFDGSPGVYSNGRLATGFTVVLDRDEYTVERTATAVRTDRLAAGALCAPPDLFKANRTGGA